MNNAPDHEPKDDAEECCSHDCGCHAHGEHDEMNELFLQSLQTVVAMIQRGGNYHPFAITSRENGDGELINSDPKLDAPTAVDSLYRALSKPDQIGTLRAFAVVCDIEMTHHDQTESTDAVHVAMEQREGDPVSVVVPYVDGNSGRSFGQPARVAAEARVFAG